MKLCIWCTKKIPETQQGICTCADSMHEVALEIISLKEKYNLSTDELTRLFPGMMHSLKKRYDRDYYNRYKQRKIKK